MIVFFIAFFVYLYTLFPSLAPYRDTGEMSSLIHTLGIAHPPGYPFYTLIGRVWSTVIHFGTTAYSLNVLSAVAGALAVYIFYRTIDLAVKNRFISGCLALTFAFSYLQWYLSVVSEMYSINVLFCAAVFYIIVKYADELESRPVVVYFFAFLFGFATTNRMDILLLSAGLSWVFLVKIKKYKVTTIITAALFFFLGFSLYIYLPIRSGQGPLLDWNHPADLSRFWGSLTRKTHGSTLDLISAGYEQGANFISSIKFYFNHANSGFSYLAVLFAAAGFFKLKKEKSTLAFAVLLSWFISGPFFIYKANMPPNPHALAILEAHFVTSFLPFYFLASIGLLYIFEKMNKKAVYACALVIPIVNLSQNYNDMNKRYNFVAYDYAKNILRSAPQASVVVMKKDVQLFALWNMQYAENKRLDLKIISQGLCGSFWYQDKFKILHPKTYIEKLREHSDWKNLESFNLPYKTYFSLDAEYQLGADLNETPAGLLVELSQNKTGTADEVLLNEIYPYRGKFHYNDYKEFFTPDIIDDYSKADFRTGMSFLFAKKYEKARSFFIKAINKKHLSPQVMNFMAFSYYEQGDYQKAISAYEDAVILYRKLHDMSVEFNSMPDVKSGIVKDLSDAYISLGVCYEKTGNDERSLDSYRNSASVSGGNPKAFFNMSVIYWKHQDWQNVIRELENALRIDPNYQEARFYLEQARAKLKQ